MKDKSGHELTDLLEMHIIELGKKLRGDSPVNDWIRLFNAKTQEDLDMIRHKSVGLQQAAETLETISLGKTLRWMFEEHLKAKRDRWAEDEWVRDEGRTEGRASHITELVRQNKFKGRTAAEIAEFLGEDLETVMAIYDETV